jgi:uncharacterized protein (DUF111 family)
MKTLYFEYNMGAAGDMLMAALLELHDNPKAFLDKLNGVGIPNVVVTAEPSVKCGITGTHIKVTINGRRKEQTIMNIHITNMIITTIIRTMIMVRTMIIRMTNILIPHS